jgi:hypothetical protein
VPYDNKIEFQIAPPADAKRSAKARHRKFGVRELALASTAQRQPRLRSNTSQLGKPRLILLIANDNPTRIVILSDQRESKGRFFWSLQLKPSRSKFLIANLELEFLASHTKLSSLAFSNRKKIAVFDPCSSPPVDEPRNLSSPLAHSDDHCRARSAIRQHISDRYKNAHFAFPDSTKASHESHAATREPRTTTRAAFRSTIPARPHGYR